MQELIIYSIPPAFLADSTFYNFSYYTLPKVDVNGFWSFVDNNGLFPMFRVNLSNLCTGGSVSISDVATYPTTSGTGPLSMVISNNVRFIIQQTTATSIRYFTTATSNTPSAILALGKGTILNTFTSPTNPNIIYAQCVNGISVINTSTVPPTINTALSTNTFSTTASNYIAPVIFSSGGQDFIVNYVQSTNSVVTVRLINATTMTLVNSWTFTSSNTNQPDGIFYDPSGGNTGNPQIWVTSTGNNYVRVIDTVTSAQISRTLQQLTINGNIPILNTLTFDGNGGATMMARNINATQPNITLINITDTF